MKIVSFCIFGLILLCSVNAQITQQEINEKQACINKIVLPCGNGSTDATCKKDLSDADLCFRQQGTFPSYGQLYNAIKKNCKSSNPAVQKVIDEYLVCLSSSIVLFSLLVSFFALLF